MRTYGKVLHACEAESTVLSSCMETEEAYIEAEAVDGLIMATQVDCPWREDLFTGWHFYEISKCKELIAHGVPSIHFYTVSAVDSIREVAKAIY